jgi:hypothetical protein
MTKQKSTEKSGLKTFARKNNAFLRFTPVYDLRAEVGCYLSQDPAVNVTGLSVPDFIERLTDHEDLHGCRYKEGGKYHKRYAVKLVMLLPRGFDLTQAAKMLRGYFRSLYHFRVAYFAYIRRQGQGVYLDVFFSERPYYPAGTALQIRARHDTYRSKLTGRLCKRSDPAAYLCQEKGQEVRTEKVYFLNKNTALQVPESEFQKLIEHMKALFVRVLRAIGAAIQQRIFLRRLNHSKANKYQLRNCMKVNRSICLIENDLNDLYDVMQAGYFTDRRTMEAFCRLMNRYKTYFRTLRFRISKVTLSLESGNDFRQLDENCERLLDLFAEDRDKFIQNFIAA